MQLKMYEKILKNYAKQYLPKDKNGWLKILRQIEKELENYLSEEQIRSLKKALREWSETDE